MKVHDLQVNTFDRTQKLTVASMRDEQAFIDVLIIDENEMEQRK